MKVQGTVESITEHGDGVYRVDLSVPERATRFLPGQFLHLTLADFDPTTGYWPESRVFSIASEPRSGRLTVVYSVKGAYTKRMEAGLSVGSQVWLKLPYGDFVIDENLLSSSPVVLIAGGTGVSPYLPFLKRPNRTAGDVRLFYGVRKASHLLFREELESLRNSPWLTVEISTEEGIVDGFPSFTGRLSIDRIVNSIGESFPQCSYFLSGPPTMIRKFRDDLKTRGVLATQIHIDEWE